MAEVTTVTQASYLGLESTPGVAVSAAKLYQGIGMNLKPAGDFYTGTPQGSKIPSVVYPITEYVEGDYVGLPDFNALAVALCSAINNPTPVVAGAAITRTFALNARGPDGFATYTVDRGDPVLARRATHVFANGIEITFGRREFTYSGPLLGQVFTTGVTLAGSPTEVPTVPIVPRLSDVYLDTSFANIGTTKLLRNFNGTARVVNRRALGWPQNSSLGSFGFAYEVMPELELVLRMEADAAGDAQLTPMRAGDTRFVRVVYTGPVLAATTYKFQMDFAVKVAGVPTYEDMDGLQVTPWTFRPVVDAGIPGGFSWTLINAVAAL